MKVVSLYARVSSRRQAQEKTIESQVAELECRVSEEEHELLEEYKFIDNGYNGSSLERPGLDRLRDKIKEGKIDKIYIHSPDRLSRNYIHQVILLEEFKKAEAEVIFLNCKTDSSPESNLLLQMQGAIAEYEHAKIKERHRRGILHAARRGSVSVIRVAPYGYRYIKSGEMGREGKFEINEGEAEVVKKLFAWIGEERVSIRETVRRLKKMSIKTKTGKETWDITTVGKILQNTAYKGQAGFGKIKKCPVKPKIRPRRNAAVQPKYSTIRTDKENWVYIPVPKIVDEELFDVVQERMDENRERSIIQRKKSYLLQGLIVCQCCRYAYCGICYRNKEGEEKHHYYFCNACNVGKIYGKRMVRGDVLEAVVWKKVKNVLNKSKRLINEYQNRLLGKEKAPLEQDIEREESKLKRGISRLIDSYTNEYMNREEFELRITEMKQDLKKVEEEKNRIKDRKEEEQELTTIMNSIKKFTNGIKSEIDQLDWLSKRNVIRELVERIEVTLNSITIIFRIKESVFQNREKQNMQPIVIKQRIIRQENRLLGQLMYLEDE